MAEGLTEAAKKIEEERKKEKETWEKKLGEMGRQMIEAKENATQKLKEIQEKFHQTVQENQKLLEGYSRFYIPEL